MTTRTFFRQTLAALAAVLACHSAQAVTVHHSYTAAGGNSWLASFSITNDGSVPLVESLTLYLDAGVASLLAAPLAPAGWDPLVVQPDVGLGAPGFFDVLALSRGVAVAPGQTLAGFQVRFDWGLSSAPQGLRFTVNDPVSFAVLEAGMTVPAAPPPIAEPSTWMLFGCGLIAVGASRRFNKLTPAVSIGSTL